MEREREASAEKKLAILDWFFPSFRCVHECLAQRVYRLVLMRDRRDGCLMNVQLLNRLNRL